MKALVCSGTETPAVDMVDVEDPVPAEDELVLDVKAAAVNRGELRLLSFRPAGWRPGQDIAGVVTETAADGSGPPVGSRIVAWVDQAGWAERAVAKTNRVAVISDGVSFVEAATLPVAGMTALRALREGGELLGRNVLVTGAAGGVGRFAVELASVGGGRVTAVAGGPERAQGLEELGASTVVHDIADAEGPFDIVLESAGGESLERAFEVVAHFGTVVVFGNSSGTDSRFSFRDFAQRPVRVSVFFVYRSGEPFGPDLQRLADLVGADRLHPTVGLEAPWSEAATVFAALAERRVNGKAVLTIG